MEFLAILVLPGTVALLLGARLSKKLVWLVAIVSFALAAACLACWVQLVNNGHDTHWVPGFSDALATCSWVAMSFAGGMFGSAFTPALEGRCAAVAVAISLIVAALFIAVSTVMMFNIACGFAGQCP